MAKARSTLFYDDPVVSAQELKPGEYGPPDEKSSGFVVINVEELNNLILYVCSKDFVPRLQKCYQIPDDNVINLIDRCNSTPEGIPETHLTGKMGLNMFVERFGRVEPEPDSPVIIHCRAGRNRSPVAAVLYLTTKGVEAERAKNLVEQAFQNQRDKKFKLDPFGHYDEVLKEAFSLKENIDPRTLTLRKPVKRPKIDLSKVKKRAISFN